MLPSELGSQSPNHPALRGDRFTKTQSFFFNFYLSQCDLFIPPLHGFNSPSYSSYCILLSCNTPAFQFNAQLKSQPTVLSNHPIPPNCTYTQPATFVDQQSATTSQISRQKNTKRRQEKAIDRRGLIGGKQRAPQLHIHQSCRPRNNHRWQLPRHRGWRVNQLRHPARSPMVGIVVMIRRLR